MGKGTGKRKLLTQNNEKVKENEKIYNTMWNQRYKGINSETFVDESGKYLIITACVTIF